ncbi:male sterility protein [Xylariales sp. PMI_506]|nr:male sterility protein [Xylariales sp. PMI_506]
MGFAILFLSTRLSPEAYVNLLKKTNCKKLVLSRQHAAIAHEVKTMYPLDCFDMVEKEYYDVQAYDGPRFPVSSFPGGSRRISFIVHSSGSTGLPKPIFQTHQACISNYSSGIPYRAFLTLPLFHNHGISTLMRALCAGRRIAMYNSNLPLSGSTLVEAMRSTQPESLHCVPYALKLLAETPEGIAALQKCKLVLYGGSSCPDDLGDMLVENGVYLVGHYGATEMGQLMTSFRDPSDKAWNYVRPLASSKPFLKMEPIGNGTFECVVLDGLPSKVLSNSDDPPNSYRTSDTFIPHPTIPDAWKYLGRLDDRVTLVNGEKVLPIPYEHMIRQSEYVQEAVVFGVGQAVPGLVIIPSEKARDLNREEAMKILLPVIQDANARTEAFGRIVPEMVEFLNVGAEYPRTDKGTVIRAAFYKKYAPLIEDVYTRFESPDEENGADNLRALDEPELTSYLLKLFQEKLGFNELEPSTDFFVAGVDSLQAITARAQIKREIDIGGKALSSNAIFEYPSVDLLGRHLLSLRTGQETTRTSEIEVMKELIDKYSQFPQRVPGSLVPSAQTVLITGVTGSLGAHMLSQIVNSPKIRKIFCLVRASTPEQAQERVLSTLKEKGLPDLSSEETSKILALPSDFSQESLGLDDQILEELRDTLTVIIHSAWAVNFNLGVRSFESHHIRGTYNLLNLCLSTRTVDPARLFFCSSISAAAGTPLPATIREAHIPELEHAQAMGYARSKLVTERIIRAAGEKTGMDARVLRLGQIIGDTEKGIWNLTEAIPLMIRSARTFGALPALNETPSWMPVDKMARACLELANLTDQPDSQAEPIHDLSVVYQVQNNRLFHWTRDLLPALKSAGLDFKVVSQREWVALLRESEQDPSKNPTIKLLEFFTGKYDNDNPGREGLVFDTKVTGEASETVNQGIDVVGSGLVSKMVRWWATQWDV